MFKKAFFIVATVTLLSACGGGGDDDGGSSPTPIPTAAPSSASSSSVSSESSSSSSVSSVNSSVSSSVGSAIVFSDDFEAATTSWSKWGGTLALDTTDYHSGAQSILLTERTATYEGPVRDIRSYIQPGQTYEFKAWVKTVDASLNDLTGTINVTVKYQCDGGDAQYLGDGTNFTVNGWTEVSATLAMESCTPTVAELYFSGADVAQGIFLDDVTITTSDGEGQTSGGGSSSSASSISSELGEVFIDFENGSADGWVSWTDAAGTIGVTDVNPYAGQYSLIHSGRGEGNAPTSFAVPNTQVDSVYSVSIWVTTRGNADPVSVNVTVADTCSGTQSFNWLGGASANVTADQWVEFTGTVDFSGCTDAALQVFPEGPGAGVDVLIDNLSVTLVP